MKIRIKTDIKSFAVCVYFLKFKDQMIINSEFDKLHD